jgi:hypothetical protein
MSISKNKRDELLNMIEDARLGVREEIKKVSKGIQALDEIRQLRFIDVKLSEMDEILRMDDRRSITRIKPDIARLVIDIWPMKDPLGNLICEIEYERLK